MHLFLVQSDAEHCRYLVLSRHFGHWPDGTFTIPFGVVDFLGAFGVDFFGVFCGVALDLATGNGVSSLGGIRRSSILIAILKN